MKSIARRFKKINEKNPYWSDNTCFAVAIIGQNFSPKTIRLGLNKLVDKNDYDKNDKKEIRAFLKRLTKQLEDDQKQTQLAPIKNYFSRVDSLVVNQNRSS